MKKFQTLRGFRDFLPEDARKRAWLRQKMVEVFERAFSNTSDGRKKRGAINFAETFCKTTPLLMMHGTADWRVSPKDSLDLAAKLLDAKVPYRLVMFEGGDHSLSEHRKTEWGMIHDWFDRFVKNGELLPDLEPHGK